MNSPRANAVILPFVGVLSAYLLFPESLLVIDIVGHESSDNSVSRGRFSEQFQRLQEEKSESSERSEALCVPFKGRIFVEKLP
jgi:ribulose 1,5-bisphosphate synthetase/thiazole synthase